MYYYIIDLIHDNLLLLILSSVLTFLTSFLVVTVAPIIGSSLPILFTRKKLYVFILTCLFLPFAIGGGTWAFIITNFFEAIGLKEHLVQESSLCRGIFLFVFCNLKILPLCIFFCATSSQNYYKKIQNYDAVHKLNFVFTLCITIKTIPKSILSLIGIFGGAMMAMEVSLANFMYRANPGSMPETPNIMLSRVFREIYPVLGIESLPIMALFGIVISCGLLGSAICGIYCGKIALLKILEVLSKNIRDYTNAITMVCKIIIFICIVPSSLVFISRVYYTDFTINSLYEVANYLDILLVGIFVGIMIIVISIMIAIKLRYAAKDYLKYLNNSPVLSYMLFAPAFVTTITIFSMINIVSNSGMEYFTLVLCHFIIHYPLFQYICFTAISSIPDNHVAWQRCINMNYLFSFFVDGILRNLTFLISLIGVLAVIILTDGAVSRWFSSLVKSPEELLYASVFGRASNFDKANIIVSAISIIALIMSFFITKVYVYNIAEKEGN